MAKGWGSLLGVHSFYDQLLHCFAMHVMFTLCVHVCALCLVQVIELPLKHPELFESLGIAQPKVSESGCMVVCTRASMRRRLS